MKKIFEKLRGLIKPFPEREESKTLKQRICEGRNERSECRPEGCEDIANGSDSEMSTCPSTANPRQVQGDREQFVTKMKKLGFTLAEVLVVVAIIGVISMIMIRVWHGSIDGSQYDTGVQKMISRLSQALRMNRVTHDFENWDDIFGKEGGDNIQRDLLDRNLKVVKVDDGNKIAENYKDGKFFNYSAGENKMYTLRDGIQYSLFQNEDETILIENEPVKVIMVIDVNGTRKGPNEPGKDVRMLALTVNRADEFKGGEPWCGDECVNLNGEPVKASVLPAELMNRTEAYYKCSQQGKTLASVDEMEALLSTPAGRTAAGASDTSTTCYSTRNLNPNPSFSLWTGVGNDNVTYVCYNPADNNIYRGYQTWANSYQVTDAWNLSGRPEIPNRSDDNRNIRGLCIEDKALAQAKTKYPNADGVINGTPYKLASKCWDSDENVRNRAGFSNGCNSGAWTTFTTGFDANEDKVAYFKNFCESNGMRLISINNPNDVAFISSAYSEGAILRDRGYWTSDKDPNYSGNGYHIFGINSDTGEIWYQAIEPTNPGHHSAGICVGD